MSTADKPSQSPEELLIEECCGSFDRAVQHLSSTKRCFLIADLPFVLSFAGSALTPHLVPALEHSETTGGSQSAAKIHIWDDTAAGGSVPKLPWQGAMINRRGDIRGFGSPTLHATLARDPEILSVAETDRGLAFYFVRYVRRFPLYETAAPLRPILFWLLGSKGRLLVHAGAVGDEEGAVLLAGKGGSGKSTTALACLDSGLVYLADDYCAVSSEGPARVWNLYNTAKATPTTLELLPFLRTFLTRDNPIADGKAIFFLHRAAPQKIATTRPLKAIVLPRVTGINKPRLTPAPRDAATSALAISTMIQLPGAGNQTLAAIQTLTAQLPCYYLEMGTDVGAVPQVLQALLATI